MENNCPGSIDHPTVMNTKVTKSTTPTSVLVFVSLSWRKGATYDFRFGERERESKPLQAWWEHSNPMPFLKLQDKNILPFEVGILACDKIVRII